MPTTPVNLSDCSTTAANNAPAATDLLSTADDNLRAHASILAKISNGTNDITYYEIGRFFELLCKSNPTALEMLFTPEECIMKGHDFVQRIEHSKFLSKLLLIFSNHGK
jgi:predicted nucleotidyltransferase